MQQQFEKGSLSCLQTVKREPQTQEQTQELRISDGMPDIGRIIGAWGQVILRGKEWQADGMMINGGTMVWVLYMPEEGGTPQCIESWLPFQMRWSFPQTQHDGVIPTQCFLRSVDARSLSARKMMLRTNLTVLPWAMQLQSFETYAPQNVPEDVQLKTMTYPMELPMEAGEKAFSLEETVELPPSMPRMEKLLSYQLQPQITEEKLMNDKVIFRGNGMLRVLYLADDGGLYSWDFELPFTQYGELEAEYGEEDEVLILPCVTALEMEQEETQLIMKAGLVCQYRVSQRKLVELVEDAYSPQRKVTPNYQDLLLPGILERKSQILHPQAGGAVDGMRLTDVQFLPQPVQMRSQGEEVNLEIPGQFQMLYYDMEGNLHTAAQRWEQNMTWPADSNSKIEAIVQPMGKPQGNFMAGSSQMTADLQMTLETTNTTPIPMVTGLELGELEESDPYRPSLILRRSQGQTLWDLAKENGSTVSAIREANNLQQEPDQQQMLLIPVI